MAHDPISVDADASPAGTEPYAGPPADFRYAPAVFDPERIWAESQVKAAAINKAARKRDRSRRLRGLWWMLFRRLFLIAALLGLVGGGLWYGRELMAPKDSLVTPVLQGSLARADNPASRNRAASFEESFERSTGGEPVTVSRYGHPTGPFAMLVATRASGANAGDVSKLGRGKVKAMGDARCVRVRGIGTTCVRTARDLTVAIAASSDFSRRQTAEMVDEAWAALLMD